MGLDRDCFTRDWSLSNEQKVTKNYNLKSSMMLIRINECAYEQSIWSRIDSFSASFFLLIDILHVTFILSVIGLQQAERCVIVLSGGYNGELGWKAQ